MSPVNSNRHFQGEHGFLHEVVLLGSSIICSVGSVLLPAGTVGERDIHTDECSQCRVMLQMSALS